MIQVGLCLVERVLAPAPVLGKPRRACSPSCRRNTLRRVPSGALNPPARTRARPGARLRVNVTDRQPEVVNAPDHAHARGVGVRARAASCRRVLHCTGCPGPEGRLPIDHLIQMPHDTGHAARQITAAYRRVGWLPALASELIAALSALQAAQEYVPPEASLQACTRFA